MTESFDSMASYVMKGTESFGVNFYSIEAEVKKKKTRKASSKKCMTGPDDEEAVRERCGRLQWKRLVGISIV